MRQNAECNGVFFTICTIWFGTYHPWKVLLTSNKWIRRCTLYKWLECQLPATRPREWTGSCTDFASNTVFVQLFTLTPCICIISILVLDCSSLRLEHTSLDCCSWLRNITWQKNITLQCYLNTCLTNKICYDTPCPHTHYGGNSIKVKPHYGKNWCHLKLSGPVNIKFKHFKVVWIVSNRQNWSLLMNMQTNKQTGR